MLHVAPSEIQGRSVLEVGACNVNGSLRPILESWRPAEYVGIDIAPGRGVDQICDVGEVVTRFGTERFDVVVATEVLEHVRDWRGAVSNLKRVCKTGGTMLVTTRSEGFPYHGYPYDFWRYEVGDFERIFSDCTVVALERDPQAPGVMLVAKRPDDFAEVDLGEHELHCVFLNRRVRALGDDKSIRSQIWRCALLHELRLFKGICVQTPSKVLRVLRSRRATR